MTGKISRIEADKARRQVRAYDAESRLIVAYPATIGSADNPSPSGRHQVEGVAPNLTYKPGPDFNGWDYFTFIASDGVFDSNEASVNFWTWEVNDPPVAGADSVAAPE